MSKYIGLRASSEMLTQMAKNMIQFSPLRNPIEEMIEKNHETFLGILDTMESMESPSIFPEFPDFTAVFK